MDKSHTFRDLKRRQRRSLFRDAWREYLILALSVAWALFVLGGLAGMLSGCNGETTTRVVTVNPPPEERPRTGIFVDFEGGLVYNGNVAASVRIACAIKLIPLDLDFASMCGVEAALDDVTASKAAVQLKTDEEASPDDGSGTGATGAD